MMVTHSCWPAVVICLHCNNAATAVLCRLTDRHFAGKFGQSVKTSGLDSNRKSATKVEKKITKIISGNPAFVHIFLHTHHFSLTPLIPCLNVKSRFELSQY